eukprot:SAG22_NODE_2939_length_2089_cov_1.138693_3_plen_73_part_00
MPSVCLSAWLSVLAQIVMEANTVVDMMRTGVLPACARDLQGYASTDLAGSRPELYDKLHVGALSCSYRPVSC